MSEWTSAPDVKNVSTRLTNEAEICRDWIDNYRNGLLSLFVKKMITKNVKSYKLLRIYL